MYTRTFRTHLIWTSLLLAACGTGSDGLDPHTSVNGKLPGLGDGEIGEPGGDAAGFLTDGGAPFEGAAIPTAAPVEDTGDGMSVGSGDAGGFGGGGGSDSDSALAPTASEPSGPSADVPVSGTATQRPATAGTLTAGAWDDNLNYARFSAYRERLQQEELAGMLPIQEAEHDDAEAHFAGKRAPNQTLDVALVVDTTGSMGDEITFLQQEFLALSMEIEARYPEADQRWSLVAYKDTGDVYTVRWFDFRGDAEDFRARLADQSASGGGDFPEAPDAALAIMNQLEWRTAEDTARLAFWVADAPHHDDKASALAAALRTSRELDIHLYPVASSGVDELTELTMRSAAQLTGGRYIFLTDDSGVGGAHKEPSLPCYFVTRLDDAIRRMVDVEMSGLYRAPEAEAVLRTGGDPTDGACTLASGESLQAF